MKQNTKIIITVGIVCTIIVVAGIAYHYHSENKRLLSKLDQFKNFDNKKQRSPLSVVHNSFRGIPDSLDESMKHAKFLKHKIENGDVYKSFYRGNERFGDEKVLQSMYSLTTMGMKNDINRDPNNGRGCPDFIVSYGSHDKTVVEFKLATGGKEKLKHGLSTQVGIYEASNNTSKSVRIIAYFTKDEEKMVFDVLKELDLINNPYIVCIDARKDNKPSASIAKVERVKVA